MINRFNSIGILIVILVCLGASTMFFLQRFIKPAKKITVGWKEDFDPVSGEGRPAIPEGWKRIKKPGTTPAVFSEVKDEKQDLSFLHMEADKASASLLCRPEGVRLEKTPVLRWRWRATVLPQGAVVAAVERPVDNSDKRHSATVGIENRIEHHRLKFTVGVTNGCRDDGRECSRAYSGRRNAGRRVGAATGLPGPRSAGRPARLFRSARDCTIPPPGND